MWGAITRLFSKNDEEINSNTSSLITALSTPTTTSPSTNFEEMDKQQSQAKDSNDSKQVIKEYLLIFITWFFNLLI